MTTIQKTDYTALSSDGIHTLMGVVYLPEGGPRGFFHVVHGMTEHIGRYDRIMRELAEEGYICFGFDNLGHGRTARNKRELGYIAPRHGYDLLARDIRVFSKAVMAEYGAGHTLPYYLMGHSMGSFITRLAVTKYVTPNKYICMGTGGKNAAAGAGLAVVALLKRLKGERYVSRLIRDMAFGKYNERFGGGTADDPSPWLSNDRAERQKHYDDPFCAYQFTVSAMGDLVKLNQMTNTAAWYRAMPKTMPVLLVAGENDPVGDYGCGVRQVYDGLRQQGIDVSCIIYDGARHEILNDSTYDQVKTDILNFIQA